MTPYEAFTRGAIMARNLAKQCLEEAKTADDKRATYLVSEYDRHMGRADDYDMRAAWYAPKHEQKDIAA